MKKVFLGLLVLTVFGSCVGKKKYLELQQNCSDIQITLEQRVIDLEDCKDEKASLRNQLSSTQTQLDNERAKAQNLQDQLDYAQRTNTSLLDRMADLSVISQAGAESIKKSLEAINEQNRHIMDLTADIQAKDSVNLSLVMNLKRSLSDVTDEDVTVEVKKGVVYISLSDKMLFKSGSAQINARAKEVLGKIALVLKDHKQLDILVEGHTDSVPISIDCIADNWDLSTARSTAVVRILQKDYGVNPARMTAGGRSSYAPKESNDTEAGRSVNRRTEIIILPKLDEFFQLLEPPVKE
ncbi:MAG: OmpA family protein [Saprospiraceae bacterium]|nr:OmpA family protein [Saprospiraceae bacterium]